jgi:hypothetical protein
LRTFAVKFGKKPPAQKLPARQKELIMTLIVTRTLTAVSSGVPTIAFHASQAMAQAAGDEGPGIGSAFWASVGIGIVVLLFALVYGTLRYHQWRRDQTPSEKLRRDAKTREIYRESENAE